MKIGTAALLVMLTTGSASAADLSGTWELAVRLLNDVNYVRVTFTVNGEKLTGTMNDVMLAGTVKADEVSFVATRPTGERFGAFRGKVSGDELTGTGSWPGFTDEVTWVAHRAKQKPSKPQVHQFEPKEFHRVFSDAIAPALHIFPGDTVSTWTVDAAGVDSKGVRRSLGGNPQTGPFYVEGAFPGDTLVIRLNRVRLNRDSAISSGRIASTALNPAYVERTRYQADFDSNWVLDRANGVAKLKNPSEHLKNYTVKLQPMVGCIATAPPAHQAFRTGYPGSRR